MNTEQNILKGCGKEYRDEILTRKMNIPMWFKCGVSITKGKIDLCPSCKKLLEGYQLAQKDIIKLFKEDSIYSGAVIKFEIDNMK